MSVAVRDFERVSKLGEGTFGIVYKARQRTTGAFVALKKIKLDDSDEGVPATSIREIAVLKELKHPCIVQLKNVLYYNHDDLQLVFEYVDFDLKKYMDTLGSLTKNMVQSLMFQLLSGMDYCHSRRIMHRDLKPQNLLINQYGELKIADFGLARCFGVPLRAYTHEVVTLWYRAPEVLLGTAIYGTPIDVWSVGCIFGEMLSGRPMFAGDSEVDQLFKIFQVMGTPSIECWGDCVTMPDWCNQFPQWYKQHLEELMDLEEMELDLLERMLVYTPSSRICCKQALTHPYFDASVMEYYDISSDDTD